MKVHGDCLLLSILQRAWNTVIFTFALFLCLKGGYHCTIQICLLLWTLFPEFEDTQGVQKSALILLSNIPWTFQKILFFLTHLHCSCCHDFWLYSLMCYCFFFTTYLVVWREKEENNHCSLLFWICNSVIVGQCHILH